MATANPPQDLDFEDAFANDSFGITPTPDAAGGDTGAAPPTDTPVAAVIVAEPEGSTPEAQKSGDDAAQKSADEANAAANEGAHASERGTSPAVVEVAAGTDAAADAGATDGPAMDAAQAGGLDDLSDVPEGDMQKARSWQGRLKKLEADLKERLAAAGQPATPAATADATGDAIDKVADTATDPGMAQAAEVAADKVESGEMTPEEALRMLSDDFGDTFVKAMELVVGKIFGDKMGKVSQDTESIIEHLTNSAQRAHFEQIFAQHPDFMETAKDPAFLAFVQEKGAQDVIDSGSAKDINALLTEYKAGAGAAAAAPDAAPGGEAPASAPPEAPMAAAAPAAAATPPEQMSAADPDEIDAAEGVRSAGGLRLPAPPAKQGGSFESAWDDYS